MVVGQLTLEAVKRMGGTWGSEPENMLCVVMYTDISESRKMVEQPVSVCLWGSLCVYSVHIVVLTSLAALQ